MALPESVHPYPIGTDNTQTYIFPGSPGKIYVTFGPLTELDSPSFDEIYIRDAGGNNILSGANAFNGNSLAGQTVAVPTDTVSIRLLSNGGTAYGYKVTAVSATPSVPARVPLIVDKNWPFPSTSATVITANHGSFQAGGINCNTPYHFHDGNGQQWAVQSGVRNDGAFAGKTQMMVFSSYDGMTWGQHESSPTSLGNGPTYSLGAGAFTYRKGGRIIDFAGVIVTAGVRNLQYTKFDMDGNGIDGGLFTINSNLSPAITNAAVQGIVRFSDGTVRIYFVTSNTTLAYYDFDGVSTWTGPTTVTTDASLVHVWQILLDSNDVTHLVVKKSSTGKFSYTNVTKVGTVLALHQFADALNIGENTYSDMVLEVTNDKIVIPAIILDPSDAKLKISVYRGSIISSPTWAAFEIVDANHDSYMDATMVYDPSTDTESVFWSHTNVESMTLPGTAISYSVNVAGGGWSARILFYNAAIQPYAYPTIPDFDTGDQMLTLNADWYNGQYFVHFDGSGAGNVEQPTFALAKVSGGTPAPPPQANIYRMRSRP